MLQIHQKFPLKKLNTFGVEAYAEWFVEIQTENDLAELFADDKWKTKNKLILGGGSNMLFTSNFNGLVIRMAISGINHTTEDKDVYVTAGGGVVWNDLVNYCVDRNFAGIENLSLIPGSVGASPIQNIGAYGVELKDIFHSCRAFEISTGLIRVFEKDDCKFNYRDSVFKSELKGEYIITNVTYKLSKKFIPNISYGAIKQELENRSITNPTVKDISLAVSHIRVSKLPDPSTIGNAGSFFKNPIIELEKFSRLQSTFPDIVYFPVGENHVKISAGWLIEQCGWKGKIVGNTGTWKNQALVLVNHGQASGNEIFDFSSTIISGIEKRFNIQLEREVNIL
ncbi:MAG: UDP-N-acetylmuramate dehydrogenase [Daejeonella sp.]